MLDNWVLDNWINSPLGLIEVRLSCGVKTLFFFTIIIIIIIITIIIVIADAVVMIIYVSQVNNRLAIPFKQTAKMFVPFIFQVYLDRSQ
jgi:hypothetical protein